MGCSMPGFPVHHRQSLLKLMSIELMLPSNHLILCCQLLLPSIFLSIKVFSNESVLCIRWPKYCSFSFSISPCNEYSGLISFRMDWFDLLWSKGLTRVFSNTIVQKHPFLTLSFLYNPLSHLYMTTGKTIALTRLCWQSNVSAFLICHLGWSKLLFQGASVF